VVHPPWHAGQHGVFTLGPGGPPGLFARLRAAPERHACRTVGYHRHQRGPAGPLHFRFDFLPGKRRLRRLHRTGGSQIRLHDRTPDPGGAAPASRALVRRVLSMDGRPTSPTHPQPSQSHLGASRHHAHRRSYRGLRSALSPARFVKWWSCRELHPGPKLA